MPNSSQTIIQTVSSGFQLAEGSSTSQAQDIEDPFQFSSVGSLAPAVDVDAELAEVIDQPTISTDIPGSPTPDELFTKAQDAYHAKHFDEAFLYYQQAAHRGHTLSQYATAQMLYKGEGIPLANVEEAMRYYTMAAQAGHKDAQVQLGTLYWDGVGIARDDIQAYRWFYAASLQGDPKAVKMLEIAQRNLTQEQRMAATAQLIPATSSPAAEVP